MFLSPHDAAAALWIGSAAEIRIELPPAVGDSVQQWYTIDLSEEDLLSPMMMPASLNNNWTQCLASSDSNGDNAASNCMTRLRSEDGLGDLNSVGTAVL